MDTRTGMLQKRLAVDDRSGGSEGMNAVDLDGHCLDIAVSDDVGITKRQLTVVHCFGELGFSGTSFTSTRPARFSRESQLKL